MAATFLLSNDDGIAAPGLDALAAALAPLGEVWVVAPDRERSATSHSISLHHPVRIREVGDRRFAVDGTPTDAVYLGLHHILDKRPDLVIGGINHGANLGNDILYSGTVAVAMEGALFGHPGLAVSLTREGSATFDVAAEVAQGIAATMLAEPPAPGVILNVNVPALPRDKIRGIKLCRLGYNDWSDSVGVRHDPRGKQYYWIGGERTGHDAIPDSDNNAVTQGFVAVTPIHYDLTDYRSFGYTRRCLKVDGFPVRDDALGDGPIAYPPHPRLS
jgi:5'-nucleotidase